MPSPTEATKRLLGSERITLVDIGAAGGVKRPWDAFGPFLRVVAFEPDARASEGRDASGAEMRFLRSGLADRQGKAELRLTRTPDSSSILKPNTPLLSGFGGGERFDVVGTESIDVDTLDRQLEAAGVADVDMLKIDTQGSELLIFDGARNTFSRSVVGVDVEVNFAERYEGQGNFSDIDAFLRERGFALFDLQRRFMKRRIGLTFGGPKGQLTHGTALYFRVRDGLSRLLEGTDPERARSIIRRAAVVYAAYGYFDLVAELKEERRSVFSDDDTAAIETLLSSAPRGSTSFARIRSGVARRLAAFARRLTPPRASGLFGDDDFGNV